MSQRKTPQTNQTSPRPSQRWKRWLLTGIAVAGSVLLSYTIQLNKEVTASFEGKKWAIPAQVYARGVELYENKLLAANDLEQQLKRQGYQAVDHVVRPGSFSKQGSQFTIYSRGFDFPEGYEPPTLVKVEFQGERITQLSAENQQPLPLIRLDPQPIGGIYPANYEDRVLIRLPQTPPYLAPALLAVEDRDFYSHHGVSPNGILRAMIVNLKAGHLVQGGSTLTQQLVKNFFLSNERTLSRKVKEALMALLLDARYSKDEILETYLNEVYLGQHGRRAIHGFGLASQFYFAQPIEELSLARSALLVAMVKGSSYYDPRRHPERSLERRNLVLDMLALQGIVSAETAEAAKQEPLGVISTAVIRTNDFPAYIDIVKQQLKQDYADSDLTSEGLQIFTNLDPIIQRDAQQSVSETLKGLDRANSKQELQAALVVTAAQTGDLLAVVGDRNPGYAGFNRAFEAKRQVGSLLKPAVYLTALEQPQSYTLTTLLDDTPVKVEDGHNGIWSPQNFDKKSHGLVPLYLALAKSYNQATTHLGIDVGVPAVLDTLQRLGIQETFPPYPSVLLGAVTLSPFEVAAMYQTIASGGFTMPVQAISAVVNSEGKQLSRYSLSVSRSINPAPLALLRKGLNLVMTEGTGRGAYRKISKKIQLGGKSGTTNDLRDSWFAGYSDNLVAVAWVGHDNNQPTHLTGSSGALKVWRQFMASTPIASVAPIHDDSLLQYWVKPLRNALTDKECAGAQLFPYIEDSEPTQYDGCQPVEPKPAQKQTLLNNLKQWFN